MEIIQLHMGKLSKKQLNPQHNVKYLVCEDDAKYCQKVQRLLSKVPALTELIVLVKQIN